MTNPYFEAEYNNRAKVPGHPGVIEAWVRDAAAFRAAHPPEVLAYGPTPRQFLDLFRPGRADAPVALFIHGGYWQGLDRSFASHLAGGLLAHGVAVAVPSYELCPQVPLAAIVDQLRAAARLLAGRGRLALAAGHSAGGHLAAMLLADGLVPAGLPISGLFDLAPLLSTSINGALGLDGAAAHALSPLFRPRPLGRLHAVVGGEEGAEYLTQTSRLAAAWGGRATVLPGHDHFTVVGPLADPSSALTAAALDLIRD